MSLAEACSQAVAEGVCRLLDDDRSLRAFARRVDRILQQRRCMFDSEQDRNAVLLQMDGDQSFDKVYVVGYYRRVSSDFQVARRIVQDDELWERREFCEAIHREFSTLEWSGDAEFQTELSRLDAFYRDPYAEDDEEESFHPFVPLPPWNQVEFSSLVGYQVGLISRILRFLAASKPQAVLDAIAATRGDVTMYSIAFTDERSWSLLEYGHLVDWDCFSPHNGESPV